ncbi:hypothetical protein VTH06DRAFT_7141 [Thermothelomyces fergusii]
MPVLHRDLRADNVFLQRPRGIETYGAVKLGNFGKCFVSGSVSASRETPVVAMEEGHHAGLGALRGRKARWDRHGMVVPRAQRPYTIGSDLFAVGALLYRMMSGRELPPAEECPDCGCFHISTDDDVGEHDPCEHACVADVNVDSVLQALSNYTQGLKHVVVLLLRLNRDGEWSASNVLDMAWPAYEKWLANTEDGRIYRDIFDDLWFRRQNEIRLKQQRIRAEDEEDDAEMEQRQQKRIKLDGIVLAV